MKLNSIFLLIVFSTIVLAKPLEAKNKSVSSKEKLSKVKICSEIKDDKKRLKCFDDEVVESQKNIKEIQSLFKSLTLNTPGTVVDLELEKKKKENRKRIEAYIPQIKLYELEAFYQKKSSYDETIVPALSFKLQNKGDKTLSMIEVTVYFKDKNGMVISEENYHPVTTNSFTSSSKPLKPGYIWQIERGKVYFASRVPSEWEEGSLSAEITDIEFLD